MALYDRARLGTRGTPAITGARLSPKAASAPQRWVLSCVVVPPIACIALLFSGGLFLLLLQSVGVVSTLGGNTTLFAAYRYLWNDRLFYSSLVFTTVIALLSTVLAVGGGVASALILRRYSAHSVLVKLLYQFPISVPHLVVAVSLLLFLSQSGIVSRLLYALGVLSEPSQFPELVNDRWGIGILLTYLVKEIPFVGVVTLSALQSLGTDYESVARSLGATAAQTRRHVVLPLLAPALVPVSIVVFAFTFGSYEVPYFIGGSHPTALSVLSYRYFSDVDLTLRPVALALNVCISVLILTLAFAYRGAVHLWAQRSPS